MAADLCRDCLTRFAAAPRCPSCGSPRRLSHPELDALAIAHVDCDAFYAAVEKREDPALADRPVIIGGGRRGVVSTACYVARIAGVKSAMPMFKALERCPDAVVLRPRMALYVETSRAIRALFDSLTPLVEPLSLDEAFLDLAGTARLHGASPAEALAGLQGRIEREIGVTVSVGLSHNKFLAKIASDLDKPRGFSIIGRGETEAFLADRPVSTIWGVGPRFAAALAAEGLATIADLRRMERTELMARHGAMGAQLHDLAWGRDARAVSRDRETKSVSAETTFNEDIADPDLLDAHLWRLSVKVADRLKAKEIAGRTITLKLKRRDFRLLTRSVAFSRPTQLAEAIHRAAARPLAAETGRGPFRLIGVGVSALGAAAPDEADLLDPETGRRAQAERAADLIRTRFGPDAIVKGRSLDLAGDDPAFRSRKRRQTGKDTP